MVGKKLSKKKKIKINDTFKVEYGTINHIEANAYYLIMNTWLKPLSSNIDFEKVVSKKIKTILSNKNENIFKKNHILDINIRKKGIVENKKCFLTIDITLYPNLKIYKNTNNINEIVNIYNNINNSLIYNENYILSVNK